MKKHTLIMVALLASMIVSANVHLPLLFSDNMVLQRDKPIAIWGWADKGEKIVVHFNRQIRQARADEKGHWLLYLAPEAAGGPFLLEVTGRNKLSFANVLVGEVWICSGQSNMEFQVHSAMNPDKEIAEADFPMIRHFLVPKTNSTSPKEELTGGNWQVCSPATAGGFTAVGYFFARQLYKQLHVPIGLIHTSWGGTHSETWTSRGAFEKSDEFKDMIAGMGPGDLDAEAKKGLEALRKSIDSLQGSMPAPSATASWKDAAFDDRSWPHMKLPGNWERQGMGLNNLDGTVWFRQTITLSDKDAGKSGTLSLGKIDDIDETYLNGVKIGETKDYDKDRIYNIPAGVLTAGKNTIAVRVEDHGGEGGMTGEPADMQLSVGTKKLPLAGIWSFKIASVLDNSSSGNPNSYPTLLFNGMINPLIPYTFKGVIWYQGESNAGRAYQYRKAFPLMIGDWRSRWGLGDFPFYFVQLASWKASGGTSANGSSWAELREAQAKTLDLPNTGMAVTTDIGETNDIHPKNKQDVGYRLAIIALDHLYGQKMEFSGPVYESMKAEGGKIILTFTHSRSGLVARDKYGYVKGFEIAGADKQFRYARAVIEGNTVVVSREGVDAPVAVRYGWADDAGEANLFNNDGLPAAPFRTDDWKGITEEDKFRIEKR